MTITDTYHRLERQIEERGIAAGHTMTLFGFEDAGDRPGINPIWRCPACTGRFKLVHLDNGWRLEGDILTRECEAK